MRVNTVRKVKLRPEGPDCHYDYRELDLTLEPLREHLKVCNRDHGALEFHLTQVLSGHGCFGEYLHKIGKEADINCHHCGAGNDNVEHALFAY